MQVCTRCIMDNESDKTIRFLKDGTCNYCNDTLNRIKKEYYPNNTGKKMLDNIMNTIKKDGTGKKYDCMVGISGGVDSSYVLYLGHKYRLRMLAVHVDDGLDTDLAKYNIEHICDKTKTDIVMVKPLLGQYKDLIRSFFLAGVPNLAVPQDNILHAALNDTAKTYNLRYSLSGANFALECILERSAGINALDKKHIIAIHKRFGTKQIDKLRLASLYEKYVYNRYFNHIQIVRPLNLINYNLQNALDELAEFSDYIYYGGKHHESILTRFLQCYYLPVKFGFDKRKSHFSSMIVSGQMTRDEAIEKIKKEPYISKDIKEYDFNYLARYLEMTRQEFDDLMGLPPKQHQEYPVSLINNYAGLARKFRRYLGY